MTVDLSAMVGLVLKVGCGLVGVLAGLLWWLAGRYQGLEATAAGFLIFRVPGKT
jgi:hypothetical protein